MSRVIATASAALTVVMLPIFLVGALTDELRQDLGFSEAQVGATLTLLFIVAAAAATPAGRLTERTGATWALRLGVTLAACVSVGVGAWASGWWAFTLPLALVGVAIGLVDTGAARAFSDQLSEDEQGRAFGFKEASVPAASLLSGLAIPAMAVPHGWRSTFIATVALAALVLLALVRFGRNRASPRSGSPADPGNESDARESAKLRVTAATVRLAAGVGIGSGAATAAAAFMVPALSARGVATSTAGLVLSVASMASIAARVAAGRWADRPTSRPVAAVVLLCALGAVGAVVLAFPVPLPPALVACVVLLGAGWGWTGLAFLSAVRANPGAPAAAAGVVLTGLALGGALGPIGFGALAARLSYTSAWIATACGLGIAALTAFAARKGFEHQRRVLVESAERGARPS